MTDVLYITHDGVTDHIGRSQIAPYLLALARADIGMGKRDIVPNINFFMNVPVTQDGGLTFADGVSAPGKCG